MTIREARRHRFFPLGDSLSVRWLPWLVVVLSCSSPDPLELLVFQTAAVARPFEGRLASEPEAYRPLGVATGREEGRATDDETILDLIGRVERRARHLAAGESARHRGTARLVLARYDEAIRELEAAVTHHPDDPVAFNDLTVAYLARHRIRDRPFDVIEALIAAREALRLAPSSKTARFNWALVLSRLHLRRQAAAAWRETLALEDDPQWQAEARARLRSVSSPDRLQLWRSRQRALQDGKILDLRSLVEEFPFRSRLYVEEQLLGEWARDRSTGAIESAERSLAIARKIAAALAELRHESLLLETVAVIDETFRRGSDRTQAALMEGHLEFAAGMVAYYGQRLESAQQQLAAAQRHLRRAESPLAGWAAFYLAICTYYSDADLAIAEFRSLLESTDPGRHPSLAGRLHWLLGTAAGAQERFQDGLEHFEQGLELLSASSGEAGSAFLHVLFAEVLDPLGEIEQGWSHRLRSLAALSGSGDHRRVHSMLNEAAQALLRQGLAAAAQPFLEELVVNALDWPDHPFALAEALAQRSEAWLGIEEPERALTDIYRSREVLAEVEASGLTRQLGNWLDIHEALALESSDPPRSVELMTAAFAAQDAAGYDFERPRFLAQQGGQRRQWLIC